MWYVYVLKSEKDDRHYTGMSQHVEERLIAHNQGKVRSTRSRRPFQLIYQEKVGSRSEARQRERYLKSAAGREMLKIIFSDRGSLPE